MQMRVGLAVVAVVMLVAACGQVDPGGGEPAATSPSPGVQDGEVSRAPAEEQAPRTLERDTAGQAGKPQTGDGEQEVPSTEEPARSLEDREVAEAESPPDQEGDTEDRGGESRQEAGGAMEAESQVVVEQPAAGVYGYELAGKRQTPLDAAPQEYGDDSWLEVEVSYVGEVAVLERRSSADDAVQMMALRWRPEAVVVERQRTEIPEVGVYECRVDPPLVFVAQPLQVEVYPLQQFAFDGCEAEVATEVVGREQHEGPGGEWEVWTVVRSIDYRYGQELEGRRDEVLSFSPELGMVAGFEARDEGRFRGQPFWVEEQAVLVDVAEGER